MGALAELRATTFREPCWGYHFDVQTRVFFYPRTSPNTIATAFAGLGLLDAYELAGVDSALEPAIGAGEFFIRRIPQTEAEPGAYFGYLPDDRTPIHNANMLVAALLARLARVAGRADFADAARAAVEYTVSRQRSDGEWPYGEQPGLALGRRLPHRLRLGLPADVHRDRRWAVSRPSKRGAAVFTTTQMR